MIQEEKDLLLKDLCARLPYRVKGNFQNSDDELLRNITIMYRYLEPDGMVMTGDIKPYLLPLSSITEKQKQYLKNRFCYDWDGEPYDLWKFQIEIGDADGLIDWFHENHIDYRGLIPRGLANDATGLNIY
jgi:hypothetical protein